MNKNAIFCFVILFLSLQGISQKRNQADSVVVLLKTAEDDTNKVNLLNDLSWELINTGDYISANIRAVEALELSEKINFSKGLLQSLNTIGIIYWYQGDKLFMN